jgi:hypothetical protein
MSAIPNAWETYGARIVFVIDCSDLARVKETRDESHSLLEDNAPKDAVLLFRQNKQDLPVNGHLQKVPHQERIARERKRETLTL